MTTTCHYRDGFHLASTVAIIDPHLLINEASIVTLFTGYLVFIVFSIVRCSNLFIWYTKITDVNIIWTQQLIQVSYGISLINMISMFRPTFAYDENNLVPLIWKKKYCSVVLIDEGSRRWKLMAQPGSWSLIPLSTSPSWVGIFYFKGTTTKMPSMLAQCTFTSCCQSSNKSNDLGCKLMTNGVCIR